MPIYIYNSLTRKKEELLPLSSGRLKIYTCGVTVYDECHIGHARSLYVFEVIRRYLKHRGFKVKFVRNITDIDDKIINRSKELKIGWKELAKKYIVRYYQDLLALGIQKADYEPRATENIPSMIKFIANLIAKGYAYATQTGVYFRVRNFTEYGKLSGQSIDQMLTGTRKEPDETKDDPLDFALWKISRPGEPSWRSPWGPGRPGWHIECSVMSSRFLKTETLDIHAGGRDLIFPHHENELAQSEAASGKPFARYWLHHGLLTINGQKMAKSLGNFITIQDFLRQYRDGDLLKLFFLGTHYAHPVDYNEDKIREAIKQKNVFLDFLNAVNTWPLGIDKKPVAFSEQDRSKIENICTKFQEALDDDFNTPLALGYLFELVDLGQGFKSADKKDAFRYLKSKLESFFSIFGITMLADIKIPKAVNKKIKEMQEARKAGEFDRSDSIREELRTDGYAASNTASSVTITLVRQENK